ncbi:MAG: hypothetical protein MZV65_41760 [Chromatiales bacterium]|nr:hypothetical protein [Chromatiales bacterium]
MDLPDGWDAADALADGWTPEQLAECRTVRAGGSDAAEDRRAAARR